MGRGDAAGRAGGRHSPVVSNASPLIALDRIGRIELLAGAFGDIVVPGAVIGEIGSIGLAPWIHEQNPIDLIDPQMLASGLGIGEREAIALALEIDARRVLLDDGPARRVATRLGLPVMGTGGVLIVAKRRGILPAVRPVLDELIATGFRLRWDIRAQMLADAGETD